MDANIAAPGQIISVLAIPVCAVFWLRMYRDMENNADLPACARERWTTLFIFMDVFGAILHYVNVY